MIDAIIGASWLPLVFAGLIGLSVLVYAILDGYDLGVGILMHFTHNSDEKNKMIASIGPFWNKAFCVGSFGMAFTQGYILGAYTLGFQKGINACAFSIVVGLAVVSAYCLIGASWLIMKSEHLLQKKAIRWARASLFYTAVSIIIISIFTPLVSQRIFHTWFIFPNVLLLGTVLFVTIALITALLAFLRSMPCEGDKLCWLPFVTTIGIFMLCFHGLAYSFYPYIIPNRISVYDTITSNESLAIMLLGAVIVLPLLISYTAFAYKVFHGKTKDLTYY